MGDDDNGDWVYDATKASTMVYPVYYERDATDRGAWVNTFDDDCVQYDVFRANIHFYHLKGTITCVPEYMCTILVLTDRCVIPLQITRSTSSS